MSPRSEEYLGGAHDALGAARVLLDTGHLRGAVAVFVATGRFDSELARAAARAQGDRERVAYDLEEVARERVEAILGDATAFVAAVDDLLG